LDLFLGIYVLHSLISWNIYGKGIHLASYFVVMKEGTRSNNSTYLLLFLSLFSPHTSSSSYSPSHSSSFPSALNFFHLLYFLFPLFIAPSSILFSSIFSLIPFRSLQLLSVFLSSSFPLFLLLFPFFPSLFFPTFLCSPSLFSSCPSYFTLPCLSPYFISLDLTSLLNSFFLSAVHVSFLTF
jgi:hypothetical protein